MITLAGFVTFIRDVMGITTTDLPDASPVIAVAYTLSVETVLLELLQVSPPMYEIAVYNFGGDFILNWAPDAPPSTYFTDVRKEMDLNSFVAGVIASTADEGTSESMLVPDFFKNLGFAELQLLKTPYGRAYMAIVQKFGPVWGIS